MVNSYFIHKLSLIPAYCSKVVVDDEAYSKTCYRQSYRQTDNGTVAQMLDITATFYNVYTERKKTVI